MAYLILDYHAPSNAYAIISYIKDGWHRANNSQHWVTLPNQQYHVIGHAYYNKVHMRLREVKSCLQSIKQPLNGPKIATTSDGMVEVLQLDEAYARLGCELAHCF